MFYIWKIEKTEYLYLKQIFTESLRLDSLTNAFLLY